MAANCVLCDQSFGSDEALQQHKRDSSAHVFDCKTCDHHFSSGMALQQHLRDSSAHVPFCDECDKSFDTRKGLERHLRDSPAHAPSFDCETCNRSFGSEEAREQHLRDAPIHSPSFDCETCDRSFGSEEALGQHLRDAPIHSPSFDCETCNRSFGSEEALEQHLQDAPIHQQDTETPLDAFFLSFPTFNYDPSLPPADSYAHLQRHEGWRRGQTMSKEAWNRYQDALESELKLWYGAEDSLTAWHALCRAIGIEPLPKTCEECEKVQGRAPRSRRFILTRVTGCKKDAR